MKLAKALQNIRLFYNFFRLTWNLLFCFRFDFSEADRVSNLKDHLIFQRRIGYMYLKDQATSMVGMGLVQIVPWDKYYLNIKYPLDLHFYIITEITQDAGEMFQKIVHNNQLQNKVKIKCLKIFLKNPIYFLGLKKYCHSFKIIFA